MDYGNLKVPENVTPEVQAILDSYESRNKEIENAHRKEMAKLYGGAALQLGSAFIPGTLGLKAAGGAIKALTPYVGKKIAENVATGTISGLASGAVEGLGRGLMEGENPLKTMLSDTAISALFGGTLGVAGAKIGKKLAEKKLQNGNIAPQKYFDDYVAGLAESDTLGKASPFSKEFGKFRGLQQGLTPKYTEIALDQIPHNEFDEWFNGSKIIDNEGKPLLFRDDDNVFITDGYSNNGISKYTYKMSHRAPSNTTKYGTLDERVEQGWDTNLDEVLKGYSNQPKDYFSAQGPRWYMYDDETGMEAFNAIRKVKNGANEITAYRAVPNSVNTNVLNNGDWISFSKKYAQKHGEHSLDGDYRIIEQKVSPNDVWWDGNDIREWGYDNGLPQNPDIMLQIKNPYRQALLPENWKDARAIRDKGYDGIITDDGKYIVFEKNQIKRTSDIENYDSLFNKIMAQEPITQEAIKPTAPIPPYKESNYYKQRMQRRSARQLSEEDSSLYNKIMNTSKELKAPKPIEKSLKKEGKIVIMEGSEPYKKGEQERVLSAASAKYTKDGQLKSNITEEIFDEEDNKYYLHKIYTKDGKTKMKKQVSKDETIFD